MWLKFIPQAWKRHRSHVGNGYAYICEGVVPIVVYLSESEVKAVCIPKLVSSSGRYHWFPRRHLTPTDRCTGVSRCNHVIIAISALEV